MPKKQKESEATFEEALEKLNTIVERMETAELPLDEIIQSYEEGMAHLKFCQEKLKAAEIKIEKLQLAEAPEGEEDGEKAEKDDIDLF